MTSATSTPGSVEATTTLLQEELPRLEEHQQALKTELVTVTERLESVRTALTALQALTAAPFVPAAAAESAEAGPSVSPVVLPDSEAEAASEPQVAPSESQQEPSTSTAPEDPAESDAAAVPAPRKARRTPAAKSSKAAPKALAKQKQGRPAKKTIPVKSEKAQAAQKTAPAVPAKDGGSLIEQVMHVVSAAGGAPVRAREVTEALGRELTVGSINTVRSTLDRLVATSKAHRAGRGLYQAPAK